MNTKRKSAKESDQRKKATLAMEDGEEDQLSNDFEVDDSYLYEEECDFDRPNGYFDQELGREEEIDLEAFPSSGTEAGACTEPAPEVSQEEESNSSLTVPALAIILRSMGIDSHFQEAIEKSSLKTTTLIHHFALLLKYLAAGCTVWLLDLSQPVKSLSDFIEDYLKKGFRKIPAFCKWLGAVRFLSSSS